MDNYFYSDNKWFILTDFEKLYVWLFCLQNSTGVRNGAYACMSSLSWGWRFGCVPCSELAPLTMLAWGTLQVCRMRVWEMLAESISCAGETDTCITVNLCVSLWCAIIHMHRRAILFTVAWLVRNLTYLPSCRRWSAGCYSDMGALGSAGWLTHYLKQKWTGAYESVWMTGPEGDLSGLNQKLISYIHIIHHRRIDR